MVCQEWGEVEEGLEVAALSHEVIRLYLLQVLPTIQEHEEEQHVGEEHLQLGF